MFSLRCSSVSSVGLGFWDCKSTYRVITSFSSRRLATLITSSLCLVNRILVRSYASLNNYLSAVNDRVQQQN